MSNRIEDALRRIEVFKGTSLAETVAGIESSIRGMDIDRLRTHNSDLKIDQSLISASARVKRASAQIDVVIHAAGILFCLPHILEPGETVVSSSLGAGNAGSDFDVETNKRIAEFKFIYWQGGPGESVRKKTFFQDYFKLVRTQSEKEKYFYLLNIEIPLRFLKGKSASLRMLDHKARMASEFAALYGDRYPTVGSYYAAHQSAVHFVDLVQKVSGLKEFVGLTDIEDETA